MKQKIYIRVKKHGEDVSQRCVLQAVNLSIPRAALRQQQYLFAPIAAIPHCSGSLAPGPEHMYTCMLMCTCAYV